MGESKRTQITRTDEIKALFPPVRTGCCGIANLLGSNIPPHKVIAKLGILNDDPASADRFTKTVGYPKPRDLLLQKLAVVLEEIMDKSPELRADMIKMTHSVSLSLKYTSEIPMKTLSQLEKYFKFDRIKLKSLWGKILPHIIQPNLVHESNLKKLLSAHLTYKDYFKAGLPIEKSLKDVFHLTQMELERQMFAPTLLLFRILKESRTKLPAVLFAEGSFAPNFLGDVPKHMAGVFENMNSVSKALVEITDYSHNGADSFVFFSTCIFQILAGDHVNPVLAESIDLRGVYELKYADARNLYISVKNTLPNSQNYKKLVELPLTSGTIDEFLDTMHAKGLLRSDPRKNCRYQEYKNALPESITIPSYAGLGTLTNVDKEIAAFFYKLGFGNLIYRDKSEMVFQTGDELEFCALISEENYLQAHSLLTKQADDKIRTFMIGRVGTGHAEDVGPKEIAKFLAEYLQAMRNKHETNAVIQAFVDGRSFTLHSLLNAPYKNPVFSLWHASKFGKVFYLINQPLEITLASGARVAVDLDAFIMKPHYLRDDCVMFGIMKDDQDNIIENQEVIRSIGNLRFCNKSTLLLFLESIMNKKFHGSLQELGTQASTLHEFASKLETSEVFSHVQESLRMHQMMAVIAVLHSSLQDHLHMPIGPVSFVFKPERDHYPLEGIVDENASVLPKHILTNVAVATSNLEKYLHERKERPTTTPYEDLIPKPKIISTTNLQEFYRKRSQIIDKYQLQNTPRYFIKAEDIHIPVKFLADEGTMGKDFRRWSFKDATPKMANGNAKHRQPISQFIGISRNQKTPENNLGELLKNINEGRLNPHMKFTREILHKFNGEQIQQLAEVIGVPASREDIIVQNFIERITSPFFATSRLDRLLICIANKLASGRMLTPTEDEFIEKFYGECKDQIFQHFVQISKEISAATSIFPNLINWGKERLVEQFGFHVTTKSKIVYNRKTKKVKELNNEFVKYFPLAKNTRNTIAATKYFHSIVPLIHDRSIDDIAKSYGIKNPTCLEDKANLFTAFMIDFHNLPRNHILCDNKPMQRTKTSDIKIRLVLNGKYGGLVRRPKEYHHPSEIITSASRINFPYEGEKNKLLANVFFDVTRTRAMLHNIVYSPKNIRTNTFLWKHFIQIAERHVLKNAQDVLGTRITDAIGRSFQFPLTTLNPITKEITLIQSSQPVTSLDPQIKEHISSNIKNIRTLPYFPIIATNSSTHRELQTLNQKLLALINLAKGRKTITEEHLFDYFDAKLLIENIFKFDDYSASK